MFYEEPFISGYGDRYFFRGTIKLSDSDVTHARVVMGRKLIGYSGWIPVRGGMHYDMCASGVYWAGRRRRVVDQQGTYDQVTCKKCLAMMKNTAVSRDIAWEL